MDVNALRSWGMAVSAAAMAGTLAFATYGCGEATTTASQAPSDASETILPDAVDNPVATGADSSTTEPQAVFETAQADAPPSSAGDGQIGFLVRFQGGGPLAQAQALAARGRDAQARTAAASAIARQASFRGLCFDRFTVGGAEMVLKTCASVPRADQARLTQSWAARLRAMPSVAYVDANASLTQDSSH